MKPFLCIFVWRCLSNVFCVYFLGEKPFFFFASTQEDLAKNSLGESQNCYSAAFHLNFLKKLIYFLVSKSQSNKKRIRSGLEHFLLGFMVKLQKNRSCKYSKVFFIEPIFCSIRITLGTFFDACNEFRKMSSAQFEFAHIELGFHCAAFLQNFFFSNLI